MASFSVFEGAAAQLKDRGAVDCMKIFVDTAKLDEIKEAYSWGILDGVTTNPTLIKKAVDLPKRRGEKVNIENYIRMILKTVGENCPVSLEVVGLTYEDMLREARKLYEKFNRVANNVVIKIPANPSTEKGSGKDYDGLRCIKQLAEEGVPVNTTLVMTISQALLAAKAGAAYVSPFIGRIDDYLRKKAGIKFEKGDYYEAEGISIEGSEEKLNDNGIVSGVDLLRKIVDIFRKYGLKTKIIAASVRNARQVREIAETGVDIATIPFNVIQEMITHPKTTEGVIRFSEDTVPEYRKLF